MSSKVALLNTCVSGERLLSRFGWIVSATPWTVAHQAPLSLGFPRQDYWSGLACPPPGDLPKPGIEPAVLIPLALAGVFFTTNATWEAQNHINNR